MPALGDGGRAVPAPASIAAVTLALIVRILGADVAPPYHGAPKSGAGARQFVTPSEGPRAFTTAVRCHQLLAIDGSRRYLSPGARRDGALGGAMQHARNSTGALARAALAAGARPTGAGPARTDAMLAAVRGIGQVGVPENYGQVKDGPGTKFLGTPANHREVRFFATRARGVSARRRSEKNRSEGGRRDAKADARAPLTR